MKSQKLVPSFSPVSEPPAKEGIFADMTVGCRCHFLDSGSFSLWRIAAEYVKKEGAKDPHAFYHTQTFWDYVDAYAAFIKKYRHAIDYYANVDVIPHPELTFRNQRYMEKEHGLKPVPVIHYRTDLEWVEKYIGRGKHDLIALGGLVGSTSQDACRNWIDRAFEVICNQPSRLPRVRTHGFGVTSFDLLRRYPWWSVDSSSWTKIGAYGGVLIPHRRNGRFVFDERPYVLKFSDKAKDKNLDGKHYNTLKPGERVIIQEWLTHIGVPLGENGEDGAVVEYGVRNRHSERKAANLLFYEAFRKSLPEYPWSFGRAKRATLGILS